MNSLGKSLRKIPSKKSKKNIKWTPIFLNIDLMRPPVITETEHINPVSFDIILPSLLHYVTQYVKVVRSQA